MHDGCLLSSMLFDAISCRMMLLMNAFMNKSIVLVPLLNYALQVSRTVNVGDSSFHAAFCKMLLLMIETLLKKTDQCRFFFFIMPTGLATLWASLPSR